ncbi:PUB domain containing protein [Novymonas esmeraldas]|uniref:PUB domain containing protein n=1 Tax=Novymonas esmeraldas TaxID=1808958 RepID=A0AAW0EWF4_9TRYP
MSDAAGKEEAVPPPSVPATAAASEADPVHHDSTSSEDGDGNSYSISQALFDDLTAAGFSENAIKKSIVAGCINEATCKVWLKMHEGHPDLDTALEHGVEVIIKAKRVLTEAEREAKVKELQERAKRIKEEEKLELQRKERERVEMGRKMAQMRGEMEDVRRKMDVEEARREKAADLEARRRIKIQLAADRLVRQGLSKDDALAQATREFEEAAQKARAEAAEKVALLQSAPATTGAASPSSDGAWNLSAITAAASAQNRVECLFAGDAPASAQALVDAIRRHASAEQVAESLRTLRLILGNIASDPFDIKKRTLRVSTKTFRDGILPIDEAVLLMRWCGFDLSAAASGVGSEALCMSTVVVRRLTEALALLRDE